MVNYHWYLQHVDLVSVIPVRCETPAGFISYCHHNEARRANIYNCSTPTKPSFPETILEDTNWLIVENSGLVELCSWLPYLRNLHYINVSKNNIKMICKSFIANLQKSRCKWLDLSHNKLTELPKYMQSLTNLNRIWLSGNHFHCGCSITWMIKWLNNFTTSTGDHVIVDYENVTCHSGKMKGKPIYLSSAVEMGCYPSGWKIGVGVGSGVSLLIIISIIIMTRKSREVKFFMFYYLKLDTVPKDNKNENLEMIEYDAFFCYRSGTVI